MKLNVNNQEIETQVTNLLELAGELGLPDKGVAIGVDRRVLPRGSWEECKLTEGMQILVINAVFGG